MQKAPSVKIDYVGLFTMQVSIDEGFRTVPKEPLPKTAPLDPLRGPLSNIISSWGISKPSAASALRRTCSSSVSSRKLDFCSFRLQQINIATVAAAAKTAAPIAEPVNISSSMSTCAHKLCHASTRHGSSDCMLHMLCQTYESNLTLLPFNHLLVFHPKSTTCRRL